MIDDINSAAAAKSTDEDDDEHNQTLKLGLDYGGDNKSTEPNLELSSGRQSPDNSASETKEEDAAAAAGEIWPPSKALKATRSGDDELSQPSVKRARVSVRARCDTPTVSVLA